MTNHESLLELGPGRLNETLPCLHSLRIEKTSLRFLPSLEGMVHLQDITVIDSPIEVLPLGLASLTSLRTMAFVNTSLRCLSEEVSALHGLRSLNVSGNLITDIPKECVQGLTKLERL
jgi:Leucine-rich repeat (LRR) protein